MPTQAVWLMHAVMADTQRNGASTFFSHSTFEMGIDWRKTSFEGVYKPQQKGTP